MKRTMKGYETLRIKDYDDEEFIITESDLDPKNIIQMGIPSHDVPYIEIDKNLAKDLIYIFQQWIDTNMLCIPERYNDTQDD